MMVSQVLVELRGVANLCAQTLQSLVQLELFIREQAAITSNAANNASGFFAISRSAASSATAAVELKR